jgi:predicted transglutaminase-like cysteine proteinase
MRRIVAIVMGVLAMSVSTAVAQTKPLLTRLAEAPVSTAASSRGDTTPPIGWVQFCVDNSDDCEVEARAPQRARLDERRWAQLQRINRAVNLAIEPISDLEQWSTLERWSYPVTGKGDCEDYVLEKRRRLIEAGWPRQSLLITVVRDKKGDGHAILTVRTDRGDYVLDNQEPDVKAWMDTGYRFIKRQSEEHPNLWVSLGGVDTAIVTANRGGRERVTR